MIGQKAGVRKSMCRDGSITSKSNGRNNASFSLSRRGSINLGGSNGQANIQELHQRYIEERKEKEKKETQIATIKENIGSLRAQYNCNVSLVHKLDAQIEEIKPEIKACLKTQLDYYYELLRIGKDTRGVGLSWIIKTIWYLGGKIHLRKFPKVLDQESIKFLLEVIILHSCNSYQDSNLRETRWRRN